MYRYTDIAEIVTNPSPITREYLHIWFNGAGSYGKAFAILGWPVNLCDEPLLVWDKEHGLRVDVKAEERILYYQTIFRYVNKDNGNVLRIDPRKMTPLKLYNTIRAIWSQSKLLVNCQNTYNQAKLYVERIPSYPPDSITEIEEGLCNIVWPFLIAVDYIGEYIIATMTYGFPPEKKLDVLNTIHARVRVMDWYTQAMLAWSNYKDGLLSESELLAQYGYVAGDDYELTKPRYYEVLKKPKPTIKTVDINNMRVNNLEDLAVGLHYLRSEAKRRSLVWIAFLRECLVRKKVIDISKSNK